MAFLALEAASTSSVDAGTKLDYIRTRQIYSFQFFALKSLLIFIPINIFGVLRVISRVRADVFPTVPALHNLTLSSGILRGPGIYLRWMRTVVSSTNL